jgi:hypothetical protein
MSDVEADSTRHLDGDAVKIGYLRRNLELAIAEAKAEAEAEAQMQAAADAAMAAAQLAEGAERHY